MPLEYAVSDPAKVDAGKAVLAGLALASGQTIKSFTVALVTNDPRLAGTYYLIQANLDADDQMVDAVGDYFTQNPVAAGSQGPAGPQGAPGAT